MDNEDQKTNLPDESKKQELDKNVTKEENVARSASNIKPKQIKDEKREVVVHYRKPSVFSCILLILIGILIATIVFLIIYFFKLNNNDVHIYDDLIDSTIDVPNVDNDEGKISLKLSPTDDIVVAAYAKIPTQIRGYEPYYGQLITKDNISDNNKLLFVLRQLQDEFKTTFISVLDQKDEFDKIVSKLDNKMIGMTPTELGTIIKFDLNTVSQRYKSVFGASQEVPLIDAETSLGYVYEYVPEDNCFYGHKYAGGGGETFRYKSQIYECELSEDRKELYIYDNFVAFNDVYGSGSYTTSALYNDSDCENMIVSLQRTSENGNILYNGKTYDEIMDEYINQAGKFKHTFKLDDSVNYYWFSSEKI